MFGGNRGMRSILLDGQRSLDDRFKFLAGLERKKSCSLLWGGAVMGFFGFFFAFMIGMYTFFHPFVLAATKYESGWGYFPSTVSEMVHDPKSPAGKCFFAFEMIGAVLIFQSWYPWEMRNVYIGDSMTAAFGVSWMMIRQFVPAVGMMLVATVTTTPIAQATVLDYYCIGIHLTGAVMLFAGYGVVEALTLGWGPFKRPEVTHDTIGDTEHWWRCRCLDFIFVFYSIFCVLQVVLVIPMDGADEWKTIKVPFPPLGTNGHQVAKTLVDETVLVNTASGLFLFLKVVSYASEVLCGLGLIASFLTIWFFSEERKTDLSDELFKVQ